MAPTEVLMKRSWTLSLLALPLAAFLAVPVAADVKTRERSLVKFEGMLGRMVGLFGGKGARDGIISTVALKGNRKIATTDNNGQIIDLGEEKVYDLDFKKKEYRVTTFDELRRRIKEAREQAEKDAREAREEAKEEAPEKTDPQKEWEFDFKADETGQKKQIAGYDARQVIMTVTVREKGKALEDGGGFVMTSDTWFGPEIKSLEELSQFERRYFEKLYGTEAIGLAAEQMAMMMAMFPMLGQANSRLQQEGTKIQGTPLATVTTFEAVKSKAQMEAAASQQSSGGGGLGGMLGRKLLKKDPPKQRSLVMTLTHEYQEVGTSVGAADLDIPANFKEKK